MNALEKRTRELQSLTEHWRQARWRKALQQKGEALGLVFHDVYAQLLTVQNGLCPICHDELRPRCTQFDLTDEKKLRGLLCGRCVAYLKRINGDPLRSKAPRTKPWRKINALRYLAVELFGTPLDGETEKPNEPDATMIESLHGR